MYPVGIDYALPFTIDGHAAPTNGEEPRADIRTATPGYFETMKIALLKGRFIDSRDRQGAPGHDRDQRDDGAAPFRRRGSDRQGRPQPARQGRGRRRGRRREALRARQRAARRALHAGLAAAAERHGAHRPHGVGSEGVRRRDPARGAGGRRRAADLRRQRDGRRRVAVGVPAARQHAAAHRLRDLGAAAGGGRDLRRRVVHGDAADPRARRADGARRRRRQHAAGWSSAGACCWSAAARCAA